MNGHNVEMYALLHTQTHTHAELFIALKLARNCTNIRKFKYKFCKREAMSSCKWCAKFMCIRRHHAKTKCEARARVHPSIQRQCQSVLQGSLNRKKTEEKTTTTKKIGMEMKSKRSSSTNGGGVSDEATNKKRFNFLK